MPYKCTEKEKEHRRAYYKANKDKWKHPDGSWKISLDDDKRREVQRNHYAKNKDKIRQRAKEQTLAKQKHGDCPICLKHSRLVYDHCHKNNKFRNYICSNCNLLLGHSYDSIETLNNAIKYLTSHR